MDWLNSDAVQFLRNPLIVETFLDVLICSVPIWVAVMIGLVIGWSWRPRWTGLIFLGLKSRFRLAWTVPPGLGARRLWLAFTALSAFSVLRRMFSDSRAPNKKVHASLSSNSLAEDMNDGNSDTVHGSIREEPVVNEKDLEYLVHLLEGKDGETTWQSFMEHSTPNMTYQAWRHEPEVGPTEYRSRTVFEDAAPELVRDFFWDDDFRPKWDPMLSYFKILEECPLTGTMIVHWIKKFPFFCSDREYIIGRRIWECGRTYYCVTKGVPYPALPKRDKPRRVDLYYSSWRIRAVESRKGDGQLSACEVTLVHYEDMGIPKDVAKVGVRHGMWGAVKKLHSGMRAYQLARKSGASLSRTATLARINTSIPMGWFSNSLADQSLTEEKSQVSELMKENHGVPWKLVFICGTVALVCGLHTGVVGKALLFGAARRLARK
ncbi:uncharacterized protein LOC18429490 [Amborella trichopoda]|uniref:START domain-containing protein n=1 Tax=Amborella trichopoda TaxID=13333 RepID=W1P0E3_AMBTC|nr:uncharacterized protein LOC18429490 [Amborella trichopoda]ERN01408.1 hypothetical protein AMTR_s00002p00263850 [Amborella trichopoda]|eukprot:XP_006838839.1 uncharacterized protein LOC18429490 [Amborella trichopoda]